MQSRPHSIMEVAALGHSDIQLDFRFDLMLSLFLFLRELPLDFSLILK